MSLRPRPASRLHLLLSLLLSIFLVVTGLGAVTHEYSHALAGNAQVVDTDNDGDSAQRGKHPGGHPCEICLAFAHFGPALAYLFPALLGGWCWRATRQALFSSHLGRANIVYYAQAPPY